VSLRARSSIG